MLAKTKHLLAKANKYNYAVGHFNINNLEIVQGIVQAAENLKSPVILATSEGAIEYAGMEFLYQLAKTASELSSVPIALHLDHGKNLSIITKAIKLGYSSVMIDASDYDFEKNVSLTKKVVQLAAKYGVSVEAELGTIGGKEDKVHSSGIIYTDPDKARDFVESTGCDFLAVAIGTSHGAYKFLGQAKLRIDLLKQIRQKVKVPLVLHGASKVPKEIVSLADNYGAKFSFFTGVPDSQIKSAIKNGINKINTDTDLRLAFTAGIRKFIQENPTDFDPRNILFPAKKLIQKVVEQRIRLFESVNKS